MLDVIQKLEELDFNASETFVPFGAWNYTQEDMMVYLLRQYLINVYTAEGTMSFDTPVFRHLAQRILNEVPKDNRYPRQDEYDGVLISGLNSSIILEGVLPPIKITPDAPAKIYTWTKVFVVNPYSGNKDAAIQYLEYLATKQTAEDSALYQSMNQPMLNPFLMTQLASEQARLASLLAREVPQEEKQAHADEVAFLKENIQHLNENRYLITQRGIAEYQGYAPLLVVLEDALIMYNEKLAEQSSLMINGGITLDEFIKQADDYIRLVRLERGER